MKKRNIKTCMGLFLVLAIILTMQPVSVFAEAKDVMVAQWDFTEKPASTTSFSATGGVNAGTAMLTTSMGNSLGGYTESNKSIYISGWKDGANTKYWEISLSAKGFENLRISFNSFGSSTAPRDFKLQYSTDETNYYDVPNGDFQCGSKHTATPTKENLSLPSGLNDNSEVSLRFLQTSNISISNGAISDSGNHRLYNIKILGDEIAGSTEPPEGKIEAVTAAPGDGATIAGGSKITLSTVTSGAAIEYTLNDGSVKIINSTAGAITINEFNQPDNTAVVKAKAVMNSEYSAENTFVYKQARVEPVSADKTGRVPAGTKLTLATATAGAQISYILTCRAGLPEEAVQPDQTYSGPITLEKDMFPVKLQATARLAGYLESKQSSFNFTLDDGTNTEEVYFGQIHSHTNQSDGSGSLADAYTYARDVAKLDFFAVTDHSNYFDTTSAPVEYAGSSTNTKWQQGIAAAQAAATGSFVAFYGYEMTWTSQVGHMNTFNTDGFVSRNNSKYTSSFAGMKNYYELLKTLPQSISQFNHPGKTFGDFNNFSDYDAAIDAQISLIEVGNGEGAVGSGGYFPSYGSYNKALDKGWHLAPTNNQDNHKGLWGTANTARTAIVTDNFTKAGVYDAMKNMRVYATEDSNLKIKYTANGQPLGSILPLNTEKLTISAELSDADAGDNIGRVTLVTNGGKESQVQDFDSNSALYSVNIDNPVKGYYYVKVVEDDGDIAVTAPIWVGNVEKVGIASFASSVSMPVKGEPLELSTEIFNNESSSASVDSIIYKIDGRVIAEGKAGQQISPLGTLKDTVGYTPDTGGTVSVGVYVTVTLNGIQKVYSEEISLEVRDAANIVNLGIDASHLNEYVAGNYANSITNFAKLAEEYDVRLVDIKGGITGDKLEGLAGLILTPPNRKTGVGALGEYSAGELEAMKNFAAKGKTVIVCGLADYGDGKNAEPYHAAYQQNKILEAIGAKSRIVDDEVIDNTNYVPNQNFRLRYKNHNMDCEYTRGVNPEQEYSFYSGASVYIAEADKQAVTTIVASHTTSESLDSDKDGKGGAGNPAVSGNIPALTVETLDSGAKVFTAGTVFMSNFEVQATIDNSSQLNYSNYTICQNIVKALAPVNITPISQVQTAAEGQKFTVEGIVTSNASGYDQNTAFFDCIYIQDETAGINLFPVSGNYKTGQRVQVTGTVGGYQGEKQLTVKKIELADSAVTPLMPAIVSTADANAEENRGKLVKVQGTVKTVGLANGIVETIIINDGSGDARIFVDGYINPSVKLDFIKEGQSISAVGLCSVDTLGKRIRVRDRNEIQQASAFTEINILHTNDSHGRVFTDTNNKGMIGIDKITAIKKATLNSLLVDAGDTLHGLPIANTTQGSNIVELMNMAGYDVMTPGNHDFNYGSNKLKEYAEAESTGFDIISSNIVNKADGSPFLSMVSTKTINGIRIGFFGLTTTETPIVTNPVNVSSLEFMGYLESARKAVAALKAEKADIIVCLAHVSRPDVEELAKQLSEDVAVIIDGHDHLSTNETVAGVLIAGSGQYEENLGRVTLTLDKNKRITSKASKLITKAETENVIPEKAITDRAAEMLNIVNGLFSKKIGTSEVFLSSARGSVANGIITPGVRNSEMPLGNLVADALKNALGADIAITNGGGLRADIPVGDITAGTLNAVLPFGNYAVLKEVTPKQLKAIIENGLAEVPNPAGKFPQISGMKVEFNPKALAGYRVTAISIGTIKLNLNDTTSKYRLATNDFMSNGGDGYTAIKDLKTLAEGDSLDVVFEKYVKSLPGVKITQEYARTEGRISAVTPVVTPPTTTSSASDNGSTTPTQETSRKENSIIVRLTLDKATGEAVCQLTQANVQRLVDQAKADEKAGKTTVAEIRGQIENGTKKAVIQIREEQLLKLSDETNAGIKVDTGLGTLNLNAVALESLVSAGNDQLVSFSFEDITDKQLPALRREGAGGRPAYSISIKAGNTAVKSLGDQPLKITIPYKLKPGENPNAIVVYNIYDSGNPVQAACRYSEADGWVEFITSDLSDYAVGYRHIKYSDIISDRHKDSIEFVTARELMSGMEDTQFGPDIAMTRGMLITVLGRLAEVKPSEETPGFADVAPGKYYTPYIAWAASKGITAGVGNNRFSPDRPVTREELAVILDNFMEYMKVKPKATGSKAEISDSESMASWAKKSAEKIRVSGIMELKADNSFNPKGEVDRSYFTSVLKNFIEMSLQY